MKAWDVRCDDDWHDLIFAETRNKAKKIFYSKWIEDLGWDFRYIDINANRAKAHDDLVSVAHNEAELNKQLWKRGFYTEP